VRSKVERVSQEGARREPLAERLLLEETPCDFKALIRRMIVDNDELDIRKGLSINSLQALFDVRFMPIASDDNAGQHADSSA
jgi:hypothetical protein